jgi:hypothetical protein
MPRGRRSPADTAEPKISLREYAVYTEAMLQSLRNIATLYEQPMLAHLLDLAAIEAKHISADDKAGGAE